MDLNAHPPADWTSPHAPFEIAAHCVAQKSDILILLDAWLDSGKTTSEYDGGEAEEDEEGECDWQTVNFWAYRLNPLWEKDLETIAGESGKSLASGDVSESNEPPKKAETIVVVCNRTGEENGKSSLQSCHFRRRFLD